MSNRFEKLQPENRFEKFSSPRDANPIENLTPEEALKVPREEFDKHYPNETAPNEIPGRISEGSSLTPEQLQEEEEIRKLNELRQSVPSLPITEALKAVGGGLYNAGREAVITGLSMGDALVNPLTVPFGHVNRGAEAASEMIPQYQNEDSSTLEEWLQTSAEFLPGLVGGGAGTAKILPKATSMMGKFLRWVGIGVGSEVGASLFTGDPETEKVFIDFVVPEGDFNEERWNKKLQLLGDSLILGGVVGGPLAAGGVGVRYLGGMLKKLKSWQSLPEQEREIAGELLKIISEIEVDDNPDLIRQKMESAVEFVKENKNVLIKFSDADNKLSDIDYTKDTLGILIDSLDPKIYGKQIAELESLRTTSLSGKSPQLTEALDKPSRALDETLEDVEITRGGKENISVTGDIASQEGDKKLIQPLQEELDRSIIDYQNAARGIDELIANDPTFAPLLKELGTEVNIDFSKAEGKSNEIVELLRQAMKTMDKQKDEYYNAIKDAPVDLDSIDEFLEVNGDFLPPKIRSLLEKEDLTFRELYNEIRPMASVRSNSIDPQKNYNEHQALIDLQDFIHTRVLDDISDPEVKALVERAQGYFRETYSKYWRKGQLKDIQKHLRNPDEISSKAESRVMLEDTLKNPRKPEYTDHIADLLERSEAGGSSEPMAEFALLDIANEISSVINTKGTVDEKMFIELSNKIKKYTPIFERVAPDKKEQLEGFLTQIRDKSFDKVELETTIASLEKQIAEKEEYLYDYVLKDFYERVDGDKRKILPNSFESIKNLFNDPQNRDRIQEIVELVKDSPMAMDGLQAAYSKNLREKFFTNTKTASKTKRISNDAIASFLSEDSSLAEYGEILFGEPYMNLLKTAVRNVESISSTTAVKRGQGLETPGQFGVQGQRQLNTLITWMFGVLNPKAARIRTVTGQLAKDNDPEDQAKMIVDTLLSDPDTFIRVAEDYISKNTPVLGDLHKRMIMKSLVKGGIYTATEAAETLDIESLGEFAGTVSDRTRSLADETNELLNNR